MAFFFFAMQMNFYSLGKYDTKQTKHVTRLFGGQGRKPPNAGSTLKHVFFICSVCVCDCTECTVVFERINLENHVYTKGFFVPAIRILDV